MGSTTHKIKDVYKRPNRRKITPQDKIVSSYLKDRSDVFRDLEKVQSDVWNDPQAAAYFRGQRYWADNMDEKARQDFFVLMCKIGGEIDAASGGGLSLQHSHPQVLDLCMAPGGFTESVLKRNHDAYVCAFTLPRNLGGHIIIHRKDPRVSRNFGDITMLHQEFRVTGLPQDHPEFSKLDDLLLWTGKTFDLIFCDGQAFVEAVRLTVSQLILAMQRIKSGGTLIMALHNLGVYDTTKIVSIFDRAAKIQIFKPVSGPKTKGSFYLIAKEVQPGHPEIVAALNEWKKIWKALTFPIIDEDKNEDEKELFNKPELAEEVLGLLDRFADRVIELGEPIWQIQKEALATLLRSKRGQQDLNKSIAGEGSTNATKSTVVAAHDLEEDVNDAGDPDEASTAPVSGKALDPIASSLADSGA